jgi:hypothetical protein
MLDSKDGFARKKAGEVSIAAASAGLKVLTAPPPKHRKRKHAKRRA